jgi:anti-sigma regulatory factor (Ser/Thr protein kinase)
VEWHPTRGIPLGAMRGGPLRQTLEDHTLELAHGDLIAQFTDGISEAFDRGGTEPFGIDRVEQAVREHAALGASEVVKALGTAVAEWSAGEPQDDETLLVVSRLPLAAGETPAAGRERRDPLAQLAEARAAGAPLVLHASLESLATLGPWLERAPDLAELDADLRSRVELALYEVCANIAEHGLGFDESRQFDLWWVPATGPRLLGTDVDARVRAGYFLLRDDGYPFSPGRWQPRDLGDPALRLRGRGLGLDLIHLAMDEVAYRPATMAGNITVLTFEPDKARRKRKEEGNG